MAINPLGPQGSPQTGASRAGEAPRGLDAAPATAGTPTTPDAITDDLLQLSDTAATAAAGDVPTGQLSADALRVITQRLAAGEYDSSAVAGRIADKLLGNGDL